MRDVLCGFMWYFSRSFGLNLDLEGPINLASRAKRLTRGQHVHFWRRDVTDFDLGTHFMNVLRFSRPLRIRSFHSFPPRLSGHNKVSYLHTVAEFTMNPCRVVVENQAA